MPGVSRAGDDAYLEGSPCAKGYAADSLRKEVVSKLKITMIEHGKGKNGTQCGG